MSTLKTIGFIDSGIGGLNVLNGVMNYFEGISAIYYGDNKNVPYGNKTEKELFCLLKNSINTVVRMGASVVVVACGTLSTTFYNNFQNVGVPVILTLPPTINLSIYKRPTIIATPKTITSKYVSENFKDVFKLPLPFLASEIENNIFSIENIKLSCDLLGVPANSDAIILGCTHYYFLKDVIEKSLQIPCFDATANVINKLLNDFKILNIYKKSIVTQKKVAFVGESAEYNSKVYKEILKGVGNIAIIPSKFDA